MREKKAAAATGGVEGAQPQLSFPDGSEVIPQFNPYVLDFCNCLWRNKVAPRIVRCVAKSKCGATGL